METDTIPPSPTRSPLLPVTLFSIATLGSRSRSLIVAASEVSSILEGRISGASTGGELEETGRVLSEYPAPFLIHF